jgi:hypothetical protein
VASGGGGEPSGGQSASHLNDRTGDYLGLALIAASEEPNLNLSSLFENIHLLATGQGI